MPRPRKRAEDRLTKRLFIRVTEDEHAGILSIAEDSSRTVSDVIRDSAPCFRLQFPERKRVRLRQPVKNADELAELLRHVGKIGANINQLAYRANCGSWPQAEEIAQAKEHLQWMRRTLMAALSARTLSDQQPAK